MTGLTTGALAKESGVNLESIRFYEREGLLLKPPRTNSGYRAFPTDTVARVRFIKRAQELGFTLKDIKELLLLSTDPDSTCCDVREQALEKIAEIDTKIGALRRMKRGLARLASACSGDGPASHCPILESLNDERNARTRGSTQ